MDEEGYLCLPGQGYVLDDEGQPMQLNTDKVVGDENGLLFTEDGGYLGRIGVYTFEDNGALEINAQGLYTGDGATLNEDATVYWGYLERSNVDIVQEMTDMISCQRAFQSAAQVTKMYDELLTKATTDLGRL
jgi:flagellar basal-body rod protein FlgG